MRCLALLLLLPLLSSGEEPTGDALEGYLSGASNSLPSAATPAQFDEQRTAIRAALMTGGSRLERAWGLIFNMGPYAAPLWPELRRAYLAVPLQNRRYQPGAAVAALGPLAEDLLQEALADPARLGLDWEQVMRIATDPAQVMPALRKDLAGDNPGLVRDAALALRNAAWSSAARVAIPELVAALTRWRDQPKLGEVNELMVNGMHESNDPDHEDDLNWRIHVSVADPWPAVLVALASLEPASPEAVATALPYLADGVPAYRRRAALEACALLDAPLPPAEMAQRLAPWLGPSPRGRLALAALERTGSAAMPVLAALPLERWLPLTEVIARRVSSDWNLVLPEPWAGEMAKRAVDRKQNRLADLLPWCGAAGIEAALASTDPEVQKRATWTFIGQRVPAPTRAPAGLMEAMRDTDEGRHKLAAHALEAWIHAPWVAELVPALLSLPQARRNGNSSDPLPLRILAGDVDVLAWVQHTLSTQGDESADIRQTLGYWRDGLPASLQGTIRPASDPFPIQGDPRLAERLAAEPFQVLELSGQQFRQLIGMPLLSDACLRLLHAKLRRFGDGRAFIAALLMPSPRYREEMIAVIRQELHQRGPGELSQLMYSGFAGRLDAGTLAPYLIHPDPRVRLMAQRLLAR